MAEGTPMDQVMGRSTIDFTAARNLMVDGQIRPNRVYDPRVLHAMRTLPRERFLPPALWPRAYTDEDVELAGGRMLLEPLVMARLAQAAAPIGGERALIVASGVGYGAALLAACGLLVTAVEDDPALLAIAQPVLAEFAPEVRQVTAPPAQGVAAGAPFDIILIEGGVRTVPDVIARQLREDGGRLLTLRVGNGPVGQAVLGEWNGTRLSMQALFDCSTRLLPAFQQSAGFVF